MLPVRRLVLLADIPDDAAWISRRKYIIRYVPGNNAAGSDHRAGANAHAGKNQRAATHPNIRAYRNWFAELLLSTEPGIQRMHGR